MNEPTEERIKRFWEWCGFTRHPSYTYYEIPFGKSNKVPCWVSPLGNTIEQGLPLIDLNNLFKYAVPKALVTIMEQQECDFHVALQILFKKWEQLVETIEFIPSALFWAIYRVIESK